MENLFSNKIKELREKNNLSLQELADQVGIAKQSIHKFEHGVVKPSSSTLLKIADVCNISYSFFYDDLEKYKLDFNDIKFRERHKIQDEDFVIEIKETVCHYLAKFIELADLLDETFEFENPLAGFEIETEKDIEKAAKMIRKKWKIGNAPIIDVVETLENNGVFVVEIKKAENFTGLSGKANDKIPIIVLNEFSIPERKRFTALHELAHIVLEFASEPSEKKLERFCDYFAGAVLLVDDVLYTELGKNRTVITLGELKRIKELYGASIQAIIMRASTSGFIDYKTSSSWWKSYNEWVEKDSLYNDFGTYKRSSEKTTLFKTLLLRAVAERRLSYSKAAELADKKVDVMRKELDQLKFKVN
ncbi:MAG TPA: XRE family transcriptional regulator [Hanamia sp.]|nr:XRE family transcriptional regulator [Hanamia sp.]